MVTPRVRLHDRDPTVALSVASLSTWPSVAEHAAVAVIRVLIQAQVPDHHVLVTELVVQAS
jgi:hypothetical protein